ncbi:MAG: VWA domain-containing protein, partial [Bacteroidota bacterium]
IDRNYPLLKLGLRGLGFILLFIAMLGPYWGTKEESTTMSSREIYLLLDVSASMNAQDVMPSRLDKAKQTLTELIRQMKGEKIGLILFTEQAYVQCPLTRDHQAVQLFLELAQPQQFTQTGTQFRSALAVAMDRFINVDKTSQKIGRGIVLVSDGEDFGDKYVSLVERLKGANITVFPLGVGTYEGAPIPHFANDSRDGFKRYEDGTMAISRLVEDDLRSMADEFGTDYLHLDDPFLDVGMLREQIYERTASPVETSSEEISNNTYQLFVFLSVVCLLLSMFMMPIRQI